MSWYDNVINAVSRSREIVASPILGRDEDRSKKAVSTDPSWIQSPIYGQPRNIDYSVLETYEKNITVQAAVNFIVDSVATCKWNITVDKDVTDEIDTTEVTDFFNANSWHESFETMLREVIYDILLYDCGTIVLSFPEFCYDDDKNLIRTDVTPLSLRARDGRSFMIQTNEYGDILNYWQYSFMRHTAAPIKFNQNEIIYIRESPNSRGPYGTSKLQVVQNIADLMSAVELGHRSEQEQNIAIGGVIKYNNINDAEFLKRQSYLHNSQKGAQNRGKWLVTGSEVDVLPLNPTDIDNSWVTGIEYYQMAILSIFKTPKTILGFTDSSTNRATSISQATTFKRNGAAVMMTLLENFFTRDIVKKYFDNRLNFEFIREIDLTDESIRSDIDASQIAIGTRTANEIRKRDGFKEIEELEEVPEPTLSHLDSEMIPEEKTEKSATIDKMENRAVFDLKKLDSNNEKNVLKELEALYGE